MRPAANPNESAERKNSFIGSEIAIANARPELLPEAGAQRTLEAVSSRPSFGPRLVATLYAGCSFAHHLPLWARRTHLVGLEEHVADAQNRRWYAVLCALLDNNANNVF